MKLEQFLYSSGDCDVISLMINSDYSQITVDGMTSWSYSLGNIYC